MWSNGPKSSRRKRTTEYWDLTRKCSCLADYITDLQLCTCIPTNAHVSARVYVRQYAYAQVFVPMVRAPTCENMWFFFSAFLYAYVCTVVPHPCLCCLMSVQHILRSWSVFFTSGRSYWEQIRRLVSGTPPPRRLSVSPAIAFASVTSLDLTKLLRTEIMSGSDKGRSIYNRIRCEYIAGVRCAHKYIHVHKRTSYRRGHILPVSVNLAVLAQEVQRMCKCAPCDNAHSHSYPHPFGDQHRTIPVKFFSCILWGAFPKGPRVMPDSVCSIRSQSKFTGSTFGLNLLLERFVPQVRWTRSMHSPPGSIGKWPPRCRSCCSLKWPQSPRKNTSRSACSAFGLRPLPLPLPSQSFSARRYPLCVAKFSANMYETIAQMLDKVIQGPALTPPPSPLTSTIIPAATLIQTAMPVSCVDCGSDDLKAVVLRSLAIFERFVEQVVYIQHLHEHQPLTRYTLALQARTARDCAAGWPKFWAILTLLISLTPSPTLHSLPAPSP